MSCKKPISVFCLLLLSMGAFSQNTLVPDDNFEQALIDFGFDTGPLDDMVLTSNINSIPELDVQGLNISDLTGIEDFTALEILNCENNLLSVLDVTNNLSLTQLFCSANNISTIDISTLLNLQIFWCSNNLLSTLDVSKNQPLISLVCGNNLLKTLDVSQNIDLVVLAFENNEISSIDISNNPKINRLQCGKNRLSSLDISKNPNVTYVSCEQNNITTLDTSNNLILSTLICYSNLLSELDLSKNTSLIVIDCSSNNLCRLNLKNGNNNFAVADFKLNNLLKCVVVDNPSNTPNNWDPLNYEYYVSSEDLCFNTVPVDLLSDFVGISYTLPPLLNGNYFTDSGGLGTPLFSGDVINASQTIYIYNETVCDSNETYFNVLITRDAYYIPKYFTPNNDGNHDLWLINDFSNQIKKIEIFDRYGKFIKYLQPNVGWNGTFNGKLMESNDYWYLVTFNSGEILRGHFSLKR